MNATIPMLLALALCAASAPPPHPRAAAEARAESYEELLDAYELAEEAFDARVEEADREARRALRAQHPAIEYWPRFEAAADAGEGRALLWMLGHLRDKGLKIQAIREASVPLYAKLFAGHADAPWFGDVLSELAGERRTFESAQLVGFYETTLARSEHAEVRAQAMFQLGQLLSDSGDAEKQAAGKRWIEKLSAELPDTRYGARAYAELHKPVVGQPAPDFTGRTIDGASFKLSDYRGKVVLLDFYGFW